MRSSSSYTTEMAKVVAELHGRGILAPETLDCSGKWARCGTADSPDSKNGAYRVISTGKKLALAALHTNHRTKHGGIVYSDGTKSLSTQHKREIEQYIADEEEKRQKRHAEAAETAERTLELGKRCKDHPYLEINGAKACPGLKIHFSTGKLMVPYHDEHGTLTTIQFINDEGRKTFLKGGKKKGSYFSVGDFSDTNPILIAEGLSTALSLHECTGYPVVMAGDAGNLLSVAQKIRRLHPGRTIILAADNDIREPGSSTPNTGLVYANAAALEIGALVAIPKLESGGKCDFNNVYRLEDPERVQKLVNAASRPYDMPEVAPLPKGYAFRAAGEHLDLYYKDTRIGRALYIEALARDGAGKGWGRLVTFDTSDKKRHKVYIPSGDLQGGRGSWLETISDMGWNGDPWTDVRKHLKPYLLHEVSRRVLLVSSTGWHNGVYVLPDGNFIGTTQGEEPMLHPVPTDNQFEVRGTLEGWQGTIGAWSAGNSRLVLAISAAFAGFLLNHYDWAESFGFHLFGKSSKGKSTSLQAAASCCGRGSLKGGGYIRSWKMTENAPEALAAASSDALLILDEMAKADARVVDKTAYDIASGQGKARLDSDSKMKGIRQWRCIVLSSGEKTFAGKLAEAGISPKAGQIVRLLDIPAVDDSGEGILENIHDFKTSNAFVKAIKRAAVKDYGHVGLAFIARLAKKDHDVIARALQKYMGKNLSKLCDDDADGQVQRVADHFLLCAFAGHLATKWGLVPWEKGEALRAIKKCFKAWRTTRGTTGAFEDGAIVAKVKLFVERYGETRFENLDDGRGLPVRDRVGFKALVKGQTRYLFLPESFRAEICTGQNDTQVAKILHQHGMLLRDKDGYLLRTPREIPGMGRPRCYTIVIPETARK